MRRATAAVLAALLLLLAGCAGLPTTGRVNPGLNPIAADDEPGVAFAPDGPQPGASPEQIVDGFLRAGTGSQDSWATAEEFLTPEFAKSWEPLESVTIDRLGDRSVTSTAVGEDTSSVIATVTATGQLDDTGAYSPQSAAPSDLPFELERVDGEWRIALAPDGLVLFEEQFRNVFRSASLSFFDPTWEFLVPDVRWFPSTNTTAYVTAALAAGPSPWLVGAVVSAFPEGVSLAGSASGGVAEVEIGESALSLDAASLSRMQRQLDATLLPIRTSSVRMTVDGSPLQVTAAPVRSTRVDTRSLVQTDDSEFGFLDDDVVEPLGELSKAVESLGITTAVEAGPDRDVAAVLASSGAVVRAVDDGTTATLDSRSELLPPSVDPTGAIWTVPAGEPSEVVVHPLDSATPIAVENAWPEATRIHALQVARDGTRVAGLVTVRGRVELWVAGIRRADGPGIQLGDPYSLATIVGAGLDLAWLGDSTIAVLDETGGEVRLREQTVGGPGTDLTVPAGVRQVVGGNDSPRLLAVDGTVYVRQATTWRQLANGVRVLATQQGTP